VNGWDTFLVRVRHRRCHGAWEPHTVDLSLSISTPLVTRTRLDIAGHLGLEQLLRLLHLQIVLLAATEHE
jgi:hypothetical protein